MLSKGDFIVFCKSGITIGNFFMLYIHSIFLKKLYCETDRKINVLFLKLNIYFKERYNQDRVLRALYFDNFQYYCSGHICSEINWLLFKNYCSKEVQFNDLANTR